jgi:hypothetical protein
MGDFSLQVKGDRFAALPGPITIVIDTLHPHPPVTVPPDHVPSPPEPSAQPTSVCPVGEGQARCRARAQSISASMADRSWRHDSCVVRLGGDPASGDCPLGGLCLARNSCGGGSLPGLAQNGVLVDRSVSSRPDHHYAVG